MTPRLIQARISRLTTTALLLGAIGCGELPYIASTCGNGVKESGEDCDTYAEAGKTCNSACHYACKTSDECPDGSVCGLEGTCNFECSSDGTTCKFFTQDPSDQCQVDAGADQPGVSGRPCPCGDPNSGDDEARICRLTSGSYTTFGDVVAVPAEQVKFGDFDGDRRQDLLTMGAANPLWLAYPRLQFFDKAGQVQNIFDPGIPVTSPSIVSLHPSDSTHGQQQVVFSSNNGIGTFDVGADRSVLPIAYPIQQMPQSWSYRMALVRGNTSKPYGETVVLCMNQSEREIIAVADDMSELAPMPQPLANLLGDPVTAHLIDPSMTPCDQILLTFSGDGRVYLLSPCDSAGNLGAQTKPPLPPAAVVTLAGGHALGKAPLVGAINLDDTTLDLLLTDDQGQVYVSFGDGKGAFSADPSNPTATAGTAWPVSVQAGVNCRTSSPLNGQFPLALGNLNADTRTDWVSPSGIQLTEDVEIDRVNAKVTIKACTTNSPFVGTWSIARVADLNRDGFLDVVAGSTHIPDLDFLQGTGFDFLNPSGIITAGPARYMVTGDFDGDLIDDVAFTETALAAPTNAGASTSTIDRLAIAYGNPSGAPGAPIEIGQFNAVKQILSGKYFGIDAIDELGVIAEPSDASGQQLSVFIGTPGRHPIAPLGLSSSATGVLIGESPLVTAVGNLNLGAGAHPSVVSVGRGRSSTGDWEHRIWVVPGNATGGFDAPICSPPASADFVPYQQDQESVSVALALRGVDGNSKAEAYALTSGQNDGNTILWQIVLPQSNDSWSSPSAITSALTQLATMTGQITATSSPTLVDLDGDGFQDLVVLLVDALGHERLGILWNDGKTPNLPLFYADLYVADPADAPALKSTRGFAVRTSGTLSSLVAVTDGGTYGIVSPSSDPAKRRALSVERIANLPSGTAIAVGDVNGDGLLDFAIAVPGGVQLYREQVCSDSSCDSLKEEP